MDFITKRLQIKKMLVFLEYREIDQINLPSRENKTYPSLNGSGEFFLNTWLNRMPLPFPSLEIVNVAYAQIMRESKSKLLSLAVTRKIPRFEHILKKCYNLEFIPQ